jgi:hypothetical protein
VTDSPFYSSNVLPICNPQIGQHTLCVGVMGGVQKDGQWLTVVNYTHNDTTSVSLKSVGVSHRNRKKKQCKS